jgi:hypothetical protein
MLKQVQHDEIWLFTAIKQIPHEGVRDRSHTRSLSTFSVTFIPAIRMKLANMACPYSVAMLSG